MTDCRDIDTLISGYIDNELTQSQRQRVAVHLEDCAACRSQHDALLEVRRSIAGMDASAMTADAWHEMIDDATAKTSRRIGWILFVAGILVVMSYGAYEFLTRGEGPLLVRLATGTIIVGLISLFVSVLRQRLIERRTDKFKDVEI